MTTPHERTKAVIDTRELLQMLARAEEITVSGLVQTVALGLLRHYPLDIDLDVSASALPGIWAAPKRRRPGSTAAPGRPTRGPGSSEADETRNKGADDDQTACGS
ncbi:BPSL0761 family protein [Paraburkholderia sp. Ac-20347]|uniref:BPSL0761 family protein n=1 Tax=Paraburkholderia sp. Ac-20347 TaxID=2703892 RepID=UPI001F1274C4|nr:BPSL0761 family protein [Paraburkholderia sp. Ac-20347]